MSLNSERPLTRTAALQLPCAASSHCRWLRLCLLGGDAPVMASTGCCTVQYGVGRLVIQHTYRQFLSSRVSTPTHLSHSLSSFVQLILPSHLSSDLLSPSENVRYSLVFATGVQLYECCGSCQTSFYSI